MLPILSVLAHVKDRDDYLRAVVGFAKKVGFDLVSAQTIQEGVAGQFDLVSIDNRSASYSAYDNRQVARRDPVMQFLKHNSVPLVWDQSFYVAHGAADLWEEQAVFGYRCGIAVPMHLPAGRHFLLGVDRDQPLPANQRHLERMTADLQLFAVYAQEVAARVLTPPQDRQVAALSPREVDALLWTMEGKTAWEVGKILNISERTVTQHIGSAMRKLDCVNKQQAVVKALRLGLIR
jgi:DNA-binding CsgD family transcriptional regulator